jgi:hypothetical protein
VWAVVTRAREEEGLAVCGGRLVREQELCDETMSVQLSQMIDTWMKWSKQ